MTLLAGLVLLIFAWWFLKSSIKADPKKLAALVRRAGGLLALAAALLLVLRGHIETAIPLGLGGAYLLGWDQIGPFKLPGGRAGAGRRGGTVLRSRLIELEVDPFTRRTTGRVRGGPLAGRQLDELSPAELRELAELVRRDDADGLRLLEAYLDRRSAAGREHAERDGHAGPRPNPQGGAMTKEEAYQVLGLEPGADADVIRRAHRELMKKLHPDQGGSTYLASRVNQAKDVLLNRHR